MDIGQKHGRPMGPRASGSEQMQASPLAATLRQVQHLKADVQRMTQAGPLSPDQSAHLVERFASVYRHAAQPSVPPSEAAKVFSGLEAATQHAEALSSLTHAAARACKELRQGSPVPPFQAPVPQPRGQALRDPTQQDAHLASEQARPHKLQPSPSPSETSRNAALQRQGGIKRRPGAGRPLRASPPAETATSTVQAPQGKENAPPSLPNPWASPQAHAAGEKLHQQVGVGQPLPPPGAAVLSGRVPPEQFVNFGGVDRLRPLTKLNAPGAPARAAPVELRRPLTPNDKLVVSMAAHQAGSGIILAVDAAGNRFTIPEARYLAVRDPKRGELHLVESKRLGGGSFGDFSVGLMARDSGTPILTAIKKIRFGGPASDANAIAKEFERHGQIWAAFSKVGARREVALSTDGEPPLAGVRSSVELPRVYRAVFDAVQGRGIMITSVFDGDTGIVQGRLRSRYGTSPAVRNCVTRSFLTQAGSQLGIMHNELGLLHLDVKTENVLFNGSGQMVVTDFGLSMSMREAQRERSTARGSMPIPEAFSVFAPPGVSTQQFRQFSPKSDAFCLALSALDMLACDTGIQLARWHGEREAPRQQRQQGEIAFLRSIQTYLAQLDGPPGQRRLDPNRLPNRLGDPVEIALNHAARSDPALTQVLLAALETDPQARPTVEALAREAARGLPPAGSRVATATTDFLSRRGDDMRTAQPRTQLGRLAGALPGGQAAA